MSSKRNSDVVLEPLPVSATTAKEAHAAVEQLGSAFGSMLWPPERCVTVRCFQHDVTTASSKQLPDVGRKSHKGAVKPDERAYR